jgi:hypothetical protein
MVFENSFYFEKEWYLALTNKNSYYSAMKSIFSFVSYSFKALLIM